MLGIIPPPSVGHRHDELLCPLWLRPITRNDPTAPPSCTPNHDFLFWDIGMGGRRRAGSGQWSIFRALANLAHGHAQTRALLGYVTANAGPPASIAKGWDSGCVSQDGRKLLCGVNGHLWRLRNPAPRLKLGSEWAQLNFLTLKEPIEGPR